MSRRQRLASDEIPASFRFSGLYLAAGLGALLWMPIIALARLVVG